VFIIWASFTCSQNSWLSCPNSNFTGWIQLLVLVWGYALYARTVAVLLTGSKSSANNNSKKTSSSSSSGKKPTSFSSQKAPSGVGKKKSARSKAKEQKLSRYAWMYVGILFAAVILPLVLWNYLILQSISVLCVWVGTYYFSTIVDHFVISSPKWLPWLYLVFDSWRFMVMLH